jgi:hypothetical protein
MVLSSSNISTAHLCDIDGSADVLSTALSSSATLPGPSSVAAVADTSDVARHITDELFLVTLLLRPLIPAVAAGIFAGLSPSPLPLSCRSQHTRLQTASGALALWCWLGKAHAQQQPAGQHKPVHQVEG